MTKNKTKKFKIYFSIFIVILIALTLFAMRWEGYLEYSIFELAQSISNNTYIIPCNANTSDISVINGRCYSNKFPGLAIFASPWIKISDNLKFIFPLEKNLEQNKILSKNIITGKEIIITKGTFFHRFQIFLVTLGTTTIYFIISLCLGFLLVYRILKEVRKSFIFMLIFTLSTLLLPYSSNFINESFSASLIFISFYFLISGKRNKKKVLISGIFSGYALLSSVWAFFVLVGFILYFSLKMDRKILYFLSGVFIGVMPLLFYNFSITGNPFISPFKFQDPQIWNGKDWLLSKETYGFIFNVERSLLNLIQLTILPYRGIFFFYPIYLFLFSVVLFNIKKVNRVEKSLTIPLFIFLILAFIANSMYWYWWGGKIWVNRFLLPVIHLTYFWFFFLFYKNFIKEKNYGIIVILSILLIHSIFWNFIGITQPWIEGCTERVGEGISEYCLQKVEMIKPPFNIWLISLETLKRYGLKFRIIESILKGDIEIRSIVFYR